MSKEDNLKYLICVNSCCSSATIKGENSLGFLNNLLISDLVTLTSNKFHFTALCNPKGRIICTLWICKNEDGSIDLIYPKNKSDLLPFLSMRTFRQKIEIKVSESNVFIDPISNDILLSSNKLESKHNIIEAFYQFMFSKGLPWVDANNTEKLIPQHVNLDLHENIMSFTKGCYPGQEIIARIKFLGKIKKRMKLLEFGNESEAKACFEKSETVSVSPIIFNSVINKFQFQVVENL